MSDKFVGIILGAGYGTRLRRDIEEDASGEFAHLVDTPKPLLPVGHKPLVDHWVDAFLQAGLNITDIYVVTNEHFSVPFLKWAVSRQFPTQNILNDQSLSNETRLGACADIHLVLQEKREEIGGRSLVVVAGDTLFYKSFNLSSFLENLPENAYGLCYYELKNPAEVQKRGVLEIEPGSQRVVRFLEKPQLHETSSRKACPAFYIYRQDAVELIERFIRDKANESLDERDAPGRIVKWLIDNNLVEVCSAVVVLHFFGCVLLSAPPTFEV
eukprot:c17507_g1_i4.p1 GENE.c17507_g1_i4~~c17507_g1_i4.p1  ORF type:complete len:281 (-),score=76.01 c17507_g1_i4:204-1013(-)